MSRLLDSMKSIPQLPSEDPNASTESIRDFMKDRSSSKKNLVKEVTDDYDIPISSLIETADENDVLEADSIFDSITESDSDIELRNTLISLGRKYAHEGGSKEASDLQAQFIPQESSLKKLIADLDRDIESVGKDIDNMRLSRTRNTKAMSDMISAQSSLYSTKLSAIKEQSNIKKTVADLKMKMEAKTADQSDASLTATRAIQELFSGGTGADSVSINSDELSSSKEPEISDEERIKDIFGDREETEGDVYLKYEGKNVRIYCQIDQETGEKHLIAKDGDGNIIPEYPLPNHADELIFTIHDDLGTVTDNLGRDYLLEYV